MSKKYRVHILDGQGKPGSLSFPANPLTIKRLLAGLDVSKGNIRFVHHGDLVDDLPADLIPRWLAKGWLQEVEDGFG